MLTVYWDHKTKPSTFVVKRNAIEIYRGPFNRGYELYASLKQEEATLHTIKTKNSVDESKIK